MRLCEQIVKLVGFLHFVLDFGMMRKTTSTVKG